MGLDPITDGSLQIQVPAADGKNAVVWRNSSGCEYLAANQTYTFPLGTLGYEWDEDIDNGFQPAELSASLYASTRTLTS